MMCWCTPSIRTPFCGKPECHRPIGNTQFRPPMGETDGSQLDVEVGVRFAVGSIVKYAHDSGGQQWHGRVCAVETYTDVNGTRVFYHVRWIDPSGCPARETQQLPAEELEAA